MSSRGCKVPGCRSVHRARGLCNKHYQRRLARAVHASICGCAECDARRALAYCEEVAGRDELLEVAS